MVATPGPDIVRAALARVLASRAFTASPNLGRFLSHVVEQTLEGRSSSIKAYTIATVALGRPPEFDPSTDSIVRVEAARLRRSLDVYYATDGAHDPVRIKLPTGSYVPFFETMEPAAGGAAAPATPRWRLTVQSSLAVLIVMITLNTMMLSYMIYRSLAHEGNCPFMARTPPATGGVKSAPPETVETG